MEKANRLQDYLDVSGMNKRELADKAEVAPASVTRWVQGNREPSVYNAIKMAKVLNTTVEKVWG